MIWRVLLELVIFVLVPVVAATQVIIPVWQGRTLFPMFRESKLVEDLDTARNDVADARLEREVHRAKRTAEQVRRPMRPPTDTGSAANPES